MESYDVIVIGSGPAGSMAAKTIANQGYEVLLLEKQPLPRYKPCGGAVAVKSQKLLSFPLDYLSKNEVNRCQLYILGKPLEEISFTTPFLHLVDRTEFDNYLVRSAMAEDVKVRDNEGFTELDFSSGCGIVKTNKAKYKTKFIVGADGALSTVRPQLGLKWKPVLGIALEGEYPVIGQHPWPPGSVIVDLAWSDNNNGYSWIFPKSDYLSIGLGTFSSKLPGIKSRLENYLKYRGLEKLKPTILKGHPIPANGNVQRILHSERGVVVGDAAGLVDPLTGEGIHYALLSGKIAGEEIATALSLGKRELGEYSRKINNAISKKLKTAARLSGLVFSHPGILKKLLTSDPELGKLFLSVVYGNQSYSNFLNRLIAVTLWKSISL